jgi:hypothetical protein
MPNFLRWMQSCLSALPRYLTHHFLVREHRERYAKQLKRPAQQLLQR